MFGKAAPQEQRCYWFNLLCSATGRSLGWTLGLVQILCHKIATAYPGLRYDADWPASLPTGIWHRIVLGRPGSSDILVLDLDGQKPLVIRTI